MKTIQYKFVDLIPEILEEGMLYITIEYATALHKCICGCGSEVVTPLSPKDWHLVFDGSSVSLYPSIGNWKFACKSHYWIRNNKIIPAKSWDDYSKENKTSPNSLRQKLLGIKKALKKSK